MRRNNCSFFPKFELFFTLILSLIVYCVALPQSLDFLRCLQEHGSPTSIYISRSGSGSNTTFYNFLNHQWNTRKGIIRPMGYLLPQATSDIQNAVQCGKKHGIKMFAKGGGHSHEKHSFGDSNSVVVDMRPMSGISIDPQSKTALVGAGVLMGQLVWYLWHNGGYAIPTTDCPNAGVAGATLNGGFGVWSKRWGMLSDNVVEFQMVDANGNLLTVNNETNADLFWALCGAGGGHFGIVTNFKYKLVDASRLNVNFIQFTYDMNKFPSVIRSYFAWIQSTIEEAVHTYISLEADGQVIVYVIDVDISEEQIQFIKEAFPPNPKELVVNEYNFIEYVAAEAYPRKTVDELANVTRHEYPQYSTRVKTYFSNKVPMEADLYLLWVLCSEIPKGLFLYIDSWGGVLNQIERNATAFVHRNHLFMLHVSVRVDEPEGNDWVKRFDALAGRILESSEGFQALIDEELENYLDQYFGENLHRLVDIKRHHDPDNYFAFAQSIPTTVLTTTILEDIRLTR